MGGGGESKVYDSQAQSATIAFPNFKYKKFRDVFSSLPLDDADGSLLDAPRLFDIRKPHSKVNAILCGHAHRYGGPPHQPPRGRLQLQRRSASLLGGRQTYLHGRRINAPRKRWQPGERWQDGSSRVARLNAMRVKTTAYELLRFSVVYLNRSYLKRCPQSELPLEGNPGGRSGCQIPGGGSDQSTVNA